MRKLPALRALELIATCGVGGVEEGVPDPAGRSHTAFFLVAHRILLALRRMFSVLPVACLPGPPQLSSCQSQCRMCATVTSNCHCWDFPTVGPWGSGVSLRHGDNFARSREDVAVSQREH